MENFKQFEIDFEYVPKSGLEIDKIKELEKYINALNKVFKNESQNFVEFCVCVFKINELFKGYYSNWVYDKNRNMLRFDDIMQGFGIDQSQSSRLINCYKKYVEIEDGKPHIKKICFAFSKSKLFEMLLVDDRQLALDINNKVVRPEMSVKQIREYVKNYQAQQRANKKLDEPPVEEKPEEFNESEIPMAYDPTKYYEFSYFESKTKSQLLNMIWDLQKECKKLKEKKKK